MGRLTNTRLLTLEHSGKDETTLVDLPAPKVLTALVAVKKLLLVHGEVKC